MRRVSYFVLVFSLVIAGFAGVSFAFMGMRMTTFADVPQTHFAFTQIEAIAWRGITGGCQWDDPQTPENEALFGPDATLTRAQMAVFLEAALGHSLNSCMGKFADVPGSHPFCGFIERLADDGITGGCGPGAFCPNNPVT